MRTEPRWEGLCPIVLLFRATTIQEISDGIGSFHILQEYKVKLALPSHLHSPGIEAISETFTCAPSGSSESIRDPVVLSPVQNACIAATFFGNV
jgi:hypothetical protein